MLLGLLILHNFVQGNNIILLGGIISVSKNSSIMSDHNNRIFSVFKETWTIHFSLLNLF